MQNRICAPSRDELKWSVREGARKSFVPIFMLLGIIDTEAALVLALSAAACGFALENALAPAAFKAKSREGGQRFGEAA